MQYRMFWLVILAAVVCTIGRAEAQEHATDRGSFILGGATGLSSNRYTNESQGERQEFRSTFLYFSPRIQYLVRPGLAVGGSIDLNHSRYDDVSVTAYGLGPAVSYFFGAPDRVFLPYLSAQGSFAWVRGQDQEQVGYGGAAGVLYLLTRSVGVDGSFFYRIHRSTGDAEFRTSNHTLGLAVGFSAFAF